MPFADLGGESFGEGVGIPGRAPENRIAALDVSRDLGCAEVLQDGRQLLHR